MCRNIWFLQASSHLKARPIIVFPGEDSVSYLIVVQKKKKKIRPFIWPEKFGDYRVATYSSKISRPSDVVQDACMTWYFDLSQCCRAIRTFPQDVGLRAKGVGVVYCNGLYEGLSEV